MGKRRPRLSGAASAAADAGRAQSQQASRLAEQADRARRVELPLGRIRERHGGDARALDPDHVLDLGESIAALGLLEPLVVDLSGRLLAGAHRLAACRLLAVDDDAGRGAQLGSLCERTLTDSQRERAQALDALAAGRQLPDGLVPVRVYQVEASEDPGLALAIEAAENEKRRDYSRAEVAALADRLRAAGFIDRRGRPRAGERALRPALAAIIGRSERQVRRLLQDKSGQTSALSGQSEEPVVRAARSLARSAAQYRQAARDDRRPPCRELLAALDDLDGLIRSVIERPDGDG